MPGYQDLDAFKVSHELTVAVHRAVEGLRDRDPELAGQLWQAALTSSSRIARGSAFPGRKYFVFSLNRSVSALTELEYYLCLADGLSLIDRETGRRLEGLRARASFYVSKLLFSLLDPPEPG